MDINDKIAENTGLVYKQLSRFNMIYDQDAESLAYEALYRAILTFDESAGVALSTYAVCCINNALRRHMRNLSRQQRIEVVSYDAPAYGTDGNLSLADILEHPESVEPMLIAEENSRLLLSAFKAEYDALSPKHQKVIRMFYASDSKALQKDIAKAAGLTQASVSKIIGVFRHRIKLRMEEDE